MSVLDHESPSPYNQQSYVLIDQEGQVQGKAREVYVKSAIVDPQLGQSLAAGMHLVRGMAWSSHGIARVEVSADGGAHWHTATLLDDQGPHAWRHFVCPWTAAPGQHMLAARATDCAGNIQPTQVAFNQKGYLMNAIDHMAVMVE
jgi:hypothetical protein